VNKWAWHIISTHYFPHLHALASKALAEYLKIILKPATERVNFIKTQDFLIKVLSKMN